MATRGVNWLPGTSSQGGMCRCAPPGTKLLLALTCGRQRACSMFKALHWAHKIQQCYTHGYVRTCRAADRSLVPLSLQRQQNGTVAVKGSSYHDDIPALWSLQPPQPAPCLWVDQEQCRQGDTQRRCNVLWRLPASRHGVAALTEAHLFISSARGGGWGNGGHPGGRWGGGGAWTADVARLRACTSQETEGKGTGVTHGGRRHVHPA